MNQNNQQTQHPMSILSEKIQKHFGIDIERRIVLGGTRDEPNTICVITAPNGAKYLASARNRKIASYECALIVLGHWDEITASPNRRPMLEDFEEKQILP